MKRTSFLIFGGLLTLFLAGCSSSQVKVDAARGQTVDVHGETNAFAFFISSVNYRMLPDNKKSVLADDYVVNSPNGINADASAMNVVVQHVNSDNSSYDAYVIKAEMTLDIPQDLPPGEYLVSVSFPTVDTVKGIFSAIEPVQTPKIVFTVTVYESISDLANINWRSNFLLAVLLIGISIIGFKIDNGYIVFGASVAGLFALYFFFQSVRFIWMLSPLASILVGLNVVISIKVTYQKLWNPEG
jgi:hypothetical protein